MKRPTIFLLALAFIFLIACNSNSSSSSTANAEETPPVKETVEWVTYKGINDTKGKKVVLVSGDEEYRSEEVLPQLGKILSERHGFDCTVLFAQDPEKPGIIDPNYLHNIPGLEALDDADLMIIFTRFRELKNDQMVYIDNYLKSGKPVLAIRTATHAFHVKDENSPWAHYGNFYEKEDSPWNHGFGRLVLGERWYTHHGHHKHQSTRGLIAAGAEDHPIRKGIEDGAIWGPTDVYGVRLPLPGDSKPIILGQTVNRADEMDQEDAYYGLKESDMEVATTNPAAKNPYNPNDPMMPIAWTKSYQLPEGKNGMAFTTTIGSSTDFADEEVRRLMVNATYYLLDLDVPEKANVGIIGTYNPSPYNFHDDEHWDNKNLKIADHLK